MKYLPLILAGLWRKPLRTVLSFLSIVVAFVLFGILSAMDAGFAHQLNNARLDRLFVAPRFGGVLPLAYASKIAALPGVIVVTPRVGMRGYYRDMRNPLGVVMSDSGFFEARPEMVMTKEEIEAFARTRTGLMVGVGAAKKFGWKVGDKVPIITNVIGPESSSWH
jgi:putative ABC transport system permease protein